MKVMIPLPFVHVEMISHWNVISNLLIPQFTILNSKDHIQILTATSLARLLTEALSFLTVPNRSGAGPFLYVHEWIRQTAVFIDFMTFIEAIFTLGTQKSTLKPKSLSYTSQKLTFRWSKISSNSVFQQFT